MIGRIRTRQEFERLRRDGRRVRSGVLWCSYVLEPALPRPLVAFAIGKTVGNAVTRNRVRRRLRVLLDEAALPAGWYLVGASPAAATRSYRQLGQQVRRMVDDLDDRADVRPRTDESN